MLAEPFNDTQCLGPITDYMVQLIEERDPMLLELAARHETVESAIQEIRSRPQRDDLGHPHDGPRVQACAPSARLRINPSDPNCVERSVLFGLVAHLIDPSLAIQLATLDTPVGMHTFPVVDGKPVVLDPRVTTECLECGMALTQPGPIALDPRKALAWTVDMASQQAGALRNGPSALPVGRQALWDLVERGHPPTPRQVEAMGILLALAEYTAARYGRRYLEVVSVAVRAVGSVLDVVLARRNAHLDIAGLQFSTPKWADDIGSAIGNVGLDLGGAVARKKLDALDLAGLLGLDGGTAAVIGLLESELGKQGRTLGTVAHPPAMASFARYAQSRTG